ncbi:transposable element Tcb1 transposase [Trichonephila clavipes]|uniref:Transposable element Tcb1 transposase n=1 Tax=Trichonephila clavipes TaxID=2585209 RepID=A0A8X6V5N6_TRICX|nr:transposable element Tcb1 transposase [Trichonephila clavipes]
MSSRVANRLPRIGSLILEMRSKSKGQIKFTVTFLRIFPLENGYSDHTKNPQCHRKGGSNPNDLAGIVQRFFVNHQIELLLWPARSPGLSPTGNMWPMVAQRLTQITPPAATPDQLWQRVEAAWSAVPQEHIQSLFESTPRRVAAVISNNGGYSGH